MSKMKKVLLMCTAYVLVAALAIGGTIAYLTSTDSDVNVMTLGNVKIRQNEYQRVIGGDGLETNELEAFEQGKVMMPYTVRDPKPDDTILTIGDHRVTQDRAKANYIDKIVTVTNTGKSDAYVRTILAIPSGGSAWEPEDTAASETWLHWNTKKAMNDYWHSQWTDSTAYDGFFAEIDGQGFFIYEFTHKTAIAPDYETFPTLVGCYMDNRVNHDDVGYYMDYNTNGKYDDGDKRIEDIEVGGSVEILVISQATQKDGFADPQTALDTSFGDVTAENTAKWFAGMNDVEYVEAPTAKAEVSGEDAAKTLAALQAGTDLIVDKDMDIIAFDTNEVDAQGATVSLAGQGPDAYGYLAFLPDAGEDVTVSNLNVTGSGFVEVGHYGQGGGNYVLNNVKIKDLASTLANGDKGFTIGCAFMGYGTTTLNDCVMTGTTAVQDGVLPVDLGCGNSTTTSINGGEYGTVYCWSHSTVYVDGAEIDTMYVAPIKGTVTIKADTHVGTINVDYGTNSSYATDANLAKLVIEDGATIDAIVFNGVTYTLAEWNAR